MYFFVYHICHFVFLDFDEQTADDWDVDMSVYYDEGISRLLYTSYHLDQERNQTLLLLQSQIFFSPALPLTDGGDMDSRDYVRMRYENRLRDGLEDGSGSSQSIGRFERFTKVSQVATAYNLVSSTVSIRYLITIFALCRALAVV